jgi:hypothetical protein
MPCEDHRLLNGVFPYQWRSFGLKMQVFRSAPCKVTQMEKYEKVHKIVNESQ